MLIYCIFHAVLKNPLIKKGFVRTTFISGTNKDGLPKLFVLMQECREHSGKWHYKVSEQNKMSTYKSVKDESFPISLGIVPVSPFHMKSLSKSKIK